jgi:hypothetical protein
VNVTASRTPLPAPPRRCRTMRIFCIKRGRAAAARRITVHRLMDAGGGRRRNASRHYKPSWLHQT